MSNVAIRTALNDVSKAYQSYKSAKAKMLSDLEKNTKKLAPVYKKEETEKCQQALSNMRVSYKRTLESIKDDVVKAVGSSVPTPLTSEQIRRLESDKYYKYTPQEWQSMAQRSLADKDLLYLRAIANSAADAGIKLDNMPMSDGQALENLEKAVQIASKLSEDNLDDIDMKEFLLNDIVRKTTDGLSLFGEDGSLKEIKATAITQDAFIAGFNSESGTNAGGENNG